MLKGHNQEHLPVGSKDTNWACCKVCVEEKIDWNFNSVVKSGAPQSAAAYRYLQVLRLVMIVLLPAQWAPRPCCMDQQKMYFDLKRFTKGGLQCKLAFLSMCVKVNATKSGGWSLLEFLHCTICAPTDPLLLETVHTIKKTPLSKQTIKTSKQPQNVAPFTLKITSKEVFKQE